MDISNPTEIKNAVADRYGKAAKQVEPALCCPVEYNTQYLKVIPQNVIEKDYGCGDPSQYVRTGETVLDLGSGTGKICFIASQVVGPNGKVIGVDINDEMLAIAQEAKSQVAEAIGYSNVEFRKGMIQDLSLDVVEINQKLQNAQVDSLDSWQKFQETINEQKQSKPLIADQSVDVVVSNCVLNLVGQSEKQNLMREIYRVLRPGGRAVISDIVSDIVVPKHMMEDENLWSGCISGAFQEGMFLQAFRDVGFIDTAMVVRGDEPWQVVEDIEFRSATVIAYKPMIEKDQLESDCGDAVSYKGPFHTIMDDYGQLFERGKPVAVSRQRLNLMQASETVSDSFYFHKSAIEGDPDPFNRKTDRIMDRSFQELKKNAPTRATNAGNTKPKKSCC